MSSSRWEGVWSGPTEVDAELTAGRLRAEGIEAVVEGSGTPYRATVFPLGGTWVVRVHAAEADAARAVLEAVGEGRNVLPGLEEEGLLNADQRATLMAAGVGAVLVAAIGLLLLLREAAG